MKLKIPKTPQCPFCEKPISKPAYLPVGFSGYEAGVCECGAVYVVDETGFSRGAVFLEALFIACGGDLELALNLIPEEDYQEIWLENYDPITHTIPGEPLYEGRKIKGALCFIKLAEDLEELKAKERERSLVKEEKMKLEEENLKKYKKRLLRKEVEELLIENRFSDLLAYVLAEPLNLNVVQKVLYHPEESLRKKGAYLLGQIARNLYQREPQKVLDLIKRLLYASADSAASPWGALEAVGEIIRETENSYSNFVKNLFGFLKFPEYEISTLYALMRIAEKNPEAIKKAPYLRLLNLFPKTEALSQALILKIFISLKGIELLSYKTFLKKKILSLFNYETFAYQELSLENLWNQYEEIFKKE
ncbi:MAG: DVU0298 family protein [Caldimicrobium sp.]